jgi:hypothetical protein
MDSKITRLIEQASVIVGALPYLQAYRDKTFLIKFGGSAMDDARLVKKLMRDIVLLEVLGFNPVIVHGGGKAISKAMAEAGLEARFVNGLRVTTPEAISIVERTLSGTINPGLVQMFRDYGGKGVGIPGTEIFVGERIHEKDEQGNPIDIGEVGNVIGCLTERITEALDRREYVCFQGDRYLNKEKLLTTSFMGKEAKFPMGPFLLASKLKVPVVFYFAMREAKKNYRFHFFIAEAVVHTKEKRAEQALLEQYTQTLEKIVRQYPEQWFNYYPFWT